MSYKNKNIVRQGPFFTHFASLPLRLPHQRQQIAQLQQHFRTVMHSNPFLSSQQLLREHDSKLIHITLFKLILRHNSTREKLAVLLDKYREEINSVLSKFPLELTGINYFTRMNKSAKCKQVTVIYLEVAEWVCQSLVGLTDRLIRALLKEEIVVSEQLKDMNIFYDHTRNLYKHQTLHVSLFRASNLFEDQAFLTVLKQVKENFTPIKYQWTSFDISTMKEYDQDEFYLPLLRFTQ